MFLTIHTGQTYHYAEQKGKMIVSVTAFFFNTGALYHIAYSNGDGEVIERTAETGRYLGCEIFNLPDIRFTTTEIDFSGVIISNDNISGTVRVAEQDISVPRYSHASPTTNDGLLTWVNIPRNVEPDRTAGVETQVPYDSVLHYVVDPDICRMTLAVEPMNPQDIYTNTD